MDISKSDLIVGSLAAGVLFWQWPSIQARQADQAASVAEAKTQMAAQDKMTANQLVMAESAKCAEDRYSRGVEVVSTLQMDKAAPIREGKPIVAGAYAKRFNPAKPNPNFYMGAGSTVGDAYGTTAVLRDDTEKGYAVASYICVTPNRGVMAKALEQRPGLQRPGTGQ
jgi:hypothetical protein